MQNKISITLLLCAFLCANTFLALGQATLQEALNKADSYFNDRDYRIALRQYDSIIQLNPKNLRAIEGRASSKFYLKDYQGALADYDLMLQIDSKYTDAYAYRAGVKHRLERTDEACEDWKKALELGDNNVKELIAENCNKISENAANVIKADTNLSPMRGKTLTAVSPDIESNKAQEAMIAYAKSVEKYNESNWQDAQKLLDQAITLDVTMAQAYFLRANTKIISQDLDNALLDIDKAILFDSTLNNAYLLRGRLQMQKNNFEQANQDFSKFLSYNNEYATAYSYKAIAQAQLKQWQEALANFSKAIQLNDTQVSDFTQKTDYYHRGQVYFFLKNYAEARNDFTRHTIIFPNDTLAQLQIAETYYAEDEIPKACAIWIQYQKFSPEVKQKITDNCTIDSNLSGDIAAYIQQAKADLNASKPKNALRWLNEALGQKPNLPDALYYRGIAYLDLNKYDDAIDDFNKYIQLIPSNAEAFYHRALAYLEKNDKPQACLDFRTAFNLGLIEANKYVEEFCK